MLSSSRRTRQTQTESDKAIQIDPFIAAGTLDPIYSNGKILLDARWSSCPKATRFCGGMVEEKRHAIAEVVMHGKEHVVCCALWAASSS